MARTHLLFVMAAALFTAGCGGDTPAPAATASTTPAPAPANLNLSLVLNEKPCDDLGGCETTGIMRETNEPGAYCGPNSLTTEDDSLAFMEKDAAVVIESDAGSVVGTATLGPGAASNIVKVDAESYAYDCTWAVTVPGLAPSPFYRVKVAGNEVGVLAARDVDATGNAVIKLK